MINNASVVVVGDVEDDEEEEEEAEEEEEEEEKEREGNSKIDGGAVISNRGGGNRRTWFVDTVCHACSHRDRRDFQTRSLIVLIRFRGNHDKEYKNGLINTHTHDQLFPRHPCPNVKQTSLIVSSNEVKSFKLLTIVFGGEDTRKVMTN